VRNESNDNFLRSIQEIADLMGCSLVTAQKLKNNLPNIVHQFGRKFIIDKNELLNAIRKSNKKDNYG